MISNNSIVFEKTCGTRKNCETLKFSESIDFNCYFKLLLSLRFFYHSERKAIQKILVH